MKTYHEPARDILIARQSDVIVVGGGPAGLAAAIASARAGARTLLIEQFACLGGTATASLMACINGFRNQVEPDGTQVVRGIAEEIVLGLKASGGLGRSTYKQKSYPTEPGKLEYSYVIDPEKFKHLTLRMCVEAGVELLFHYYFCQAIVSADAMRGVIVESKSGRQAMLASVVVDATGDADVSARAGAAFWQTVKDEAPRLNDSIMYRVQFGAARPEGLHMCDLGANAVLWGPSAGILDATDAEQLSKAEVATRLAIYADLAEKTKKFPQLADAKVIETPALLGIRQTRFVEGLYKLTADDAIAGRPFDDVVAISPCPIIRYYGYRRYLEHEGYDIPYRCLVPRKIDGLLVAGRCISSEQPPYESHRSIVPILAIGQAAGAAAALCCRTGRRPRDLDVTLLQQTLMAQGAELRLPRSGQ